MSDTHNGWTNYATWRVNFEICEDIIEGLESDGEQFRSFGQLADYLLERVDECLTNHGELEGLAVDYARSFVEDVNWGEIAEHWPELIETDDEE